MISRLSSSLLKTQKSKMLFLPQTMYFKRYIGNHFDHPVLQLDKDP